MYLNIAVCDDEEVICSQLEELLQKLLVKMEMDYNIDIYNDGTTLCSAFSEKNYNLIFLDIEMPEKNGIEVAEYIHDELNDVNTKIVFISSKDGYFRQLLNTQLLGFIDKPIDKIRVEDIVNKFMKYYKQQNTIFTYSKKNEYINVYMSDIICFERCRKKISIETKRGTDEFYGVMDDIYSLVKGNRFLFIHKSVIVNYDYVERIEYEKVVMQDGRIYSISQSRRKDIRDKVLELIKEGV